MTGKRGRRWVFEGNGEWSRRSAMRGVGGEEEKKMRRMRGVLL
jgi:hypothetical protein